MYFSGRPKGSGLKKFSDGFNKSSASSPSWPSLDAPKKRTPVNLFQLNGSASKKSSKNKEKDSFPHTPVSMVTPAKGIFSSRSFEVDSFSSIANGYSSFCNQASGAPLAGRHIVPYGQRKRSEDSDPPRGRKNEFLIKLDHEGVMSPKNKSSKALLMLRGSGFGSKDVGNPTKSEAYSHPVLLVKDNRKGDNSRAELLPVQRKPSSSLMLMDKPGDLSLGCHRDCSSYSDMDEEDEKDEDRRGSSLGLIRASGGMRTTGRFLSRLSVSSSSSGSSSSSSSGSLSSSSVCSSDNDSSYSSEDEESSTLLMQSCLTSRHNLLPPSKSSSRPSGHNFVAKAVTVSGSKSGNPDDGDKSIKRKECVTNRSKPSKDLIKRQKLLPVHGKPKGSSSQTVRQLWRWSGNPTQVSRYTSHP